MNFSRNRAINRAIFMEANRNEVLQLYRELMKKTAKALPRRFEREAKLAEFRHFFRIAAEETDPD